MKWKCHFCLEFLFVFFLFVWVNTTIPKKSSTTIEDGLEIATLYEQSWFWGLVLASSVFTLVGISELYHCYYRKCCISSDQKKDDLKEDLLLSESETFSRQNHESEPSATNDDNPYYILHPSARGSRRNKQYKINYIKRNSLEEPEEKQVEPEDTLDASWLSGELSPNTSQNDIFGPSL